MDWIVDLALIVLIVLVLLVILLFISMGLDERKNRKERQIEANATNEILKSITNEVPELERYMVLAKTDAKGQSLPSLCSFIGYYKGRTTHVHIDFATDGDIESYPAIGQINYDNPLGLRIEMLHLSKYHDQKIDMMAYVHQLKFGLEPNIGDQAHVIAPYLLKIHKKLQEMEDELGAVTKFQFDDASVVVRVARIRSKTALKPILDSLSDISQFAEERFERLSSSDIAVVKDFVSDKDDDYRIKFDDDKIVQTALKDRTSWSWGYKDILSMSIEIGGENSEDDTLAILFKGQQMIFPSAYHHKTRAGIRALVFDRLKMLKEEVKETPEPINE